MFTYSMWRFLVILILLSVVFFIGLWMQLSYSRIRNHDLAFKNENAFNNFQYFNDLEEIENTGSCRPFIIKPKQSDLLAFVSPMIFSCNSPMKNWADFSNGVLTIHEKLIEKRIEENNQNFTCVYTKIIGGEELSNGTILVESSKNETTIEPGVPTSIQLEQFVVYCREPSGNHFYNKTFFNFFAKIKKQAALEKSERPNGLMIFSISGMSHNQAMRHLKQFLKFVFQNNFQSFSMFNQISKDNWNNSLKSFGEYEQVWNIARNSKKCTTFLHTDSSKFSKMFGNQFDYHPNLYSYFNQQYLGQVDNCISDGSVTVEDSVFHWTNFSLVFRHHSCHFSLLHLTEIATPEDGKVVNLDEILKISFEQLLQNDVLMSTTVVILSDGGSKNSEVFNTESGRLESKYGLLLIRLADDFREQYPEESENLRKNIDRLVSNENVAQTLKSIISKWNISNDSKFEDSLFDRIIPKTRTCKDSGIEIDDCICSNEEKIGNERRKKITKLLLKIVKKEVSAFKCLSRITIDTDNIEFRRSGPIKFFRFNGSLETERVKISETEGFSNSTRLQFSGKARFSNLEDLDLELREPLKLVNQSSNKASHMNPDHCLVKIIKEFEMRFLEEIGNDAEKEIERRRSDRERVAQTMQNSIGQMLNYLRDYHFDVDTGELESCKVRNTCLRHLSWKDLKLWRERCRSTGEDENKIDPVKLLGFYAKQIEKVKI